MENIENIIIATTCYLVLYVVGASLEVLPEGLLILMFLASPFIVIFMVYKILKDGEAPDLSFEDGYWYEDMDQIETSE